MLFLFANPIVTFLLLFFLYVFLDLLVSGVYCILILCAVLEMGDMIENQAPIVNGHANGLPAPTIIKAPLPNPSLQVTADHQLKTLEAPVYAPGPGDVLLHIKSTGICG